MTAIRCSALPLAFICGGSVRDDGGVMVSPHYDAADDGTDAHRLLESWPEGDAPPERVSELTEDARISYFSGAKMWRETIGGWMPGSVAEVEIEIDGDGLSGHVDRMAIMGMDQIKKAVVLDWKTERKDMSYKHQGFGYARLVFEAYPDVDQVTIIFAWTRTQEVESYVVTRERAEEWNRERRERIDEWDGTFHPGDHCAGCRRQATCPALRQLAKRDAEALGAASPPDVALMSAPQLVDFHRRLKVLANLLDSAEKSVRREVETRGEVEDGDGNVLHLVDEKGPREVDALKAWPTLTKRLTDEQLAGCIRVKIGDVERAVAENAGKGKGAAAKRALQADLQAAGAVKQDTIQKLKLERKANT